MKTASTGVKLMQFSIIPMLSYGPIRLPLSDGARVYLIWHSHLGPMFFRDRACQRWITNWWRDSVICAALDWFIKRGHRA